MSSKYALDVSALFADTIALYTHLTADIHQLMGEMNSISPQQIAEKCGFLVATKKMLTDFDQQILDILEVTGSDIAGEPMIHNYRLALAHASHASNNLYQHLQAQKVILQTISINSLL